MRRGGDVLLVLHAGPGEEPHWSTPGGQVEPDELATEGLAREVREETGIDVLDAGYLAIVVQVDDRRRVQLHASQGPGDGYLVTVLTFEVAEWEGELAPADPDGLVLGAAFVPVDEAILRLEPVPWHRHTVAYLSGRLAPGTAILERWHADGRQEEVATLEPPGQL